MRTRTIPLMTKPLAVALVATLSVLVMRDAQAIAVTTTDVTAAPGDSFGVTFNFDFGSDTSVTSFQYELLFDPALVTFTGESVAGQFTPFGTDATLGDLSFPGLPYEITSATDPQGGGHETAAWFAGFDESFNPIILDLSGQTSVTYLFDLSPGAAGGSTSSISAMIDSYSDAYFNSFPSLGDPSIGATATLSVTGGQATAVPEPSTLSLMLAGMGLFGLGSLLVRRRTLLRS